MTSSGRIAFAAVALFAIARPARAGMEMNGMEMNGVSLNDVTLDGATLTGVHLEGSTLTGTQRDGAVVTGAALVGARLKGWTSSGAKVQVRIDGYSEAGDVSSYAATFATDAAEDDWHPICETGGDAVPLYGTWNADGSKTSSGSVITFACPGGALAKCIDFGYAPWRSSNGTSRAVPPGLHARHPRRLLRRRDLLHAERQRHRPLRRDRRAGGHGVVDARGGVERRGGDLHVGARVARAGAGLVRGAEGGAIVRGGRARGRVAARHRAAVRARERFPPVAAAAALLSR
jgi:hypothetical protein